MNAQKAKRSHHDSKKLATAIALCALAASLTACGGSGVEAICAQQAELVCGFLYDCCDASERAIMMGLDDGVPVDMLGTAAMFRVGHLMTIDTGDSYDQDSCIENLTGYCAGNSQLAIAAEEDGRIAVHDDIFADCLAPFAATKERCDYTALRALSDQPPAACERAITGEVAAAGECYASFECGDTMYCDQNQSDPDVRRLTGSCAAKLAAGEACGYNVGPCAEGLECRYDGAGQSCAVTAQAGEACDGTTIVCEQGGFCDPGSGVCAANDPPPAELTYNICQGG